MRRQAILMEHLYNGGSKRVKVIDFCIKLTWLKTSLMCMAQKYILSTKIQTE